MPDESQCMMPLSACVCFLKDLLHLHLATTDTQFYRKQLAPALYKTMPSYSFIFLKVYCLRPYAQLRLIYDQ